ncbi:MAG: hypothetical protein KKF44_08475 [Nanoarchaeota archaeon]|nr:hypothetical protein [Nanoarchaeota archaeon]
MKIAVSADGESMDSSVDMRFGRSRYFVIVEVEGSEIKGSTAVENKGGVQGHGAGIAAAEEIGELGAKVVITGNLGPNATGVLDQLGVKSFQGSGTVKEAVEKYMKNELKLITETAEPHSGIAEQKTSSGKDAERVYFPLLDNSGLDSKISTHFGHAPFFGLYDFCTKKLTITENTLDHTDPNKSPIDQIVEAVDPTMIFAHGIGGRAIGIIKEKGLKLKTGGFATVKEAIDNMDSLSDEVSGCGHEHH